MIDEAEAFESVRGKLEKLRRLADDAPEGSGERRNAEGRIRALLQKHGLTEESVSRTLEIPVVFELVEARWGKQLFLQCAGWLLQMSPVRTIAAPSGCIVMQLNPLDAADVRACYRYYTLIMLERQNELREEAKDVRSQLKRFQKKAKDALAKNRKEQKEMIDALIVRYRLGVERKPDPKEKRRPLTARELDEWLAKVDAGGKFKGDAWERGEKLDDQEVFRLTA